MACLFLFQRFTASSGTVIDQMIIFSYWEKKFNCPNEQKTARMGKTVFPWVQGNLPTKIIRLVHCTKSMIYRKTLPMKKRRYRFARVSLRAGALPVSVPKKCDFHLPTAVQRNLQLFETEKKSSFLLTL